MATKTFYFLNSSLGSPGFFGNLQDSGTAPATALMTTGWTVAKGATSAAFWRGRCGSSVLVASGLGLAASWIASNSPTLGTASTNTTAGDCFRSAVTFNGLFVSGNWSFTFGMRTAAATIVGRVRCKVWASSNADGSSARELTSGTLVGSSITLGLTTATFNSTVTWAAPAVTLLNEYLFFQPEWETTTAGTSNSSTVQFYQSVANVVTTNFGLVVTASPAGSYALSGAATTTVLVKRKLVAESPVPI